jgi:hypothetical protein
MSHRSTCFKLFLPYFNRYLNHLTQGVAVKLYHCLTLTTLLFTALTAHADDVIWKGIDSQGHMVYSNTPKDLRNPQKIKLPDLSIISAPAHQAPPSTISTELNSPSTPALNSAQDAAPRPLTLEEALAAQKNGEDPLPGERIGTAGGASRLSPAYYARQEALAAAVKEAQAALDRPPAAH